MATTLAERRSFFNSTVYTALEKLKQVGKDNIFEIAGEVPFNKGTGDTINFAGRAIGLYGQRSNPGADIQRTTDVEADTLAKTFVSYKEEMLIEAETMLHDKLDIIGGELEDLVLRSNNTVSLEMCRQLLTAADATTMNVINNGATQSVSIACADGLAPGSASHTRPGTGATTYSNILSGLDALSEDAVTSLEQQMIANSVSEAGSHLGFQANLLIIPNNAHMKKMAAQIAQSELVPGTSNNAVNIYKGGRLDVVVLNHAPLDQTGAYSTNDQYHWALADRRLLKRGFKYSWALHPTQFGIGLLAKFSEDNFDQKIQTMGRCVFGMPDWAGIGYSFSTTQPTSPGAQ